MSFPKSTYIFEVVNEIWSKEAKDDIQMSYTFVAKERTLGQNRSK